MYAHEHTQKLQKQIKQLLKRTPLIITNHHLKGLGEGDTFS